MKEMILAVREILNVKVAMMMIVAVIMKKVMVAEILRVKTMGPLMAVMVTMPHHVMLTVLLHIMQQ